MFQAPTGESAEASRSRPPGAARPKPHREARPRLRRSPREAQSGSVHSVRRAAKRNSRTPKCINRPRTNARLWHGPRAEIGGRLHYSPLALRADTRSPATFSGSSWRRAAEEALLDHTEATALIRRRQTTSPVANSVQRHAALLAEPVEQTEGICRHIPTAIGIVQEAKFGA